MTDRLLNKKELAAMLKVSTRTVDRMRLKGFFKTATVKVGPRLVRFKGSVIERLIETNRLR